MAGCEKLPVVSFTPIECMLYEVTNKKDFSTEKLLNAIECMLYEVTNKKDFSTDQLRLMEICESINCGQCRESLSKRKLRNVCHARWLATANRILRLYEADENPSEALLTLTTSL
ncbi:hypothetical protein AVEN_131018-1 [Araneus ventricosus]|uniref:Uncharacterized protein n=1 Tax=Araneus ventricosus TaxID=182803 RepID=A0A4Y2MLH5_ARAVE|nr:hypothetical protein AVEN_131018-1 [Araneus ventricosus]